jgi:hypothetical protein
MQPVYCHSVGREKRGQTEDRTQDSLILKALRYPVGKWKNHRLQHVLLENF